MGVYIPNMDKPQSCRDCFYILKCSAIPRWITIDMKVPKSCPLIEIDESEMEYLYKEFGLEKDENLTERAQELKRAILMGYLYAKRELGWEGEE